MENKASIADLQQKIALYEDMKAYRQLYDLLYERLFWFSFSFVKSREAAEEIVSDVFIKLWTMRSQLLTVDNLSVFLYIIAKNFSLNYITRHYKYPQVSLDELPLEVDTTIDPEELYISSEMVNRIKEAVNHLPGQCKLIFQLVREDGLKYKEVAAILQLSELTVRNQLAIALKKIAAELKPNLDLRTPQKSTRS